MPLVKMPDGRTVQMPDQLSPDQAQQLRALQSPSAAIPAPPQENGKLGPVSSGFVRPVVQGLTGIATAIPDFATNLVNLIPESILGPKAQSPGAWVNEQLDKVTTAPESRSGKIAEFVDSALVGGAAGPRMPSASTASPAVRRLAGEGVVTTPGQRAGGLANTLEEKAGKILPAIGNARARAVEQWNNARLTDSLKDAGAGTLPNSLTGRDAIRYTYQKLQERYGDVLARMKADLNTGPPGSKLPVPRGQQWAPGSLRDSIEKVRTVGRNLDPSQRNTLNDIIDNQLIGKFTSSGKASGETIKEIEETLRTEAEAHESGSYQDRKLSDALYELRQQVKNALQRDNPKLAADLDKIDRGYAKYKLSARASNARPTGGGNYTPGQRLQASKARDTSKDKNAFSIGQAGGQAEAEEAQSVLGNTQPDSGTPMGMALMNALGLGGGLVGGGAALGHPEAGLSYLGALAGSGALYSPAVLKWMQDQGLRVGPELMSKLGLVGGAQQELQ